MAKKSNNINYQKWYSANSEKDKQRKNTIYKNNPEYRSKAIARAKKQRARAKDLKPELIPIKVNGVYKEMYSFHSVGVIVGRTSQTIKSWSKRDKIPQGTLDKRTLYYTENQTNLIRDYVNSNGVSKEEAITRMYKNWSI